MAAEQVEKVEERGLSGEDVRVPRARLAQLLAIEDAARWHYANSACAGWATGEVLALALDLNPESPKVMFSRLLDALGIEHAPDPFDTLLDGDS